MYYLYRCIRTACQGGGGMTRNNQVCHRGHVMDALLLDRDVELLTCTCGCHEVFYRAADPNVPIIVPSDDEAAYGIGAHTHCRQLIARIRREWRQESASVNDSA